VPEPAPKRDEPAKVIERAVTVCVRVRPMADSEIADGQTQVVACDLDAPGKIHLTRPSGGAVEPNRKQETFVFDTVLPGSAGQAAVYNLIGSPLVASLAAGYHSCIMAFGATGCGKSHTIFGGPGEARGLLPRLSEKLFAAMDAVDGKTIATLSYLELYNDKVRDLLHPEPGEQHEAPAALDVCEHPKAGVFVTGLTRSVVSDAEDILRLIDYGHKIRVLASAQRSSPSSRSTAIAVLHLEQVLAGSSGTWPEQKWRHAKLQVVDLAGAEHLHAGEVPGQRGSFPMAEMVAALAKGTQGESGSRYQSPYRDSKLSLLLAEALMGNCRTAVVTCVSPASRRADLTSSSLRFGESVQKLHTRSTRNEEAHGDLVQTLRGEIHLLRQRLDRCSPAEIRGLEVQLEAAQYLEEEYSASHEELQERNATAEQQRQRSLRRLGLRVAEPWEQKVSDGRIYVVNVSKDPLLSGCLTWTLLPGEQLHIGSNPGCEICVDGLGVQPEVCSLRCVQASRLEVVPQLVGHTAKKDGLIARRRSLFKHAGPLLVNGQTVEATLALRSGDVLRVGWAHFFRVLIPACASENDRRLGPRPEDTLAIETTYGLTFPKDAEQLKERLGADRAAQVLGGLKDLKLAVDEANELTKELRGDSQEFSFKGHRLMDPLNSSEATTLVVSLLCQRRLPGQGHFDEDNGGCNGEERAEVVATWTLPDFQQRLEVMREIYDEVALRDQPWGEVGDLDPWQAQSSIPVLKATPGPWHEAHGTQEAASLPMWKQLSSATSASTGAETSEERMDMAAVLQQLPQLHAELAKAYEMQDVQASELVSVRREIEDLRMNLARATPSPARRPGDPSRGSGTLSPLRGGEEAEMPLLSKSNLVPSPQPAGGVGASAAVAAAVRQTPTNRASTPRRPRAPVAPVWRGAEGPRISSSPTGGASNGPLMSSDSPKAEALPSPRSELLEETAISEDLHAQGGTIARDVSFGAGMPDTIKYYISAQSQSLAPSPGSAACVQSGKPVQVTTGQRPFRQFSAPVAVPATTPARGRIVVHPPVTTMSGAHTPRYSVGSMALPQVKAQEPQLTPRGWAYAPMTPPAGGGPCQAVPLQPQHAFQNRYTGHLHPAQQQVQTPTIPIAASTAQWEGRSRSPSPGLHGPRSQSAENVSLRRPSTPPAPFAVSTQCPGTSIPSTPRFMAQEAQAMAKAAAVAVAKAVPGMNIVVRPVSQSQVAMLTQELRQKQQHRPASPRAEADHTTEEQLRSCQVELAGLQKEVDSLGQVCRDFQV